jgi:crotonobetainyl-CoA:carnitine CoA-transferase CaiB-like acyl-CoA transferase
MTRSAYFCSVNWGKKSVALDLSTSGWKAGSTKISGAKSQLVIASYKPGDAEKLGVSYQQLSATNNPHLIYGQITGYGSDNDRVGLRCRDTSRKWFYGFEWNCQKGHLLKCRWHLIDVLAAHHLKEGLLLALLKKIANRRR